MITHIGDIELDLPMWWENATASNAFNDEVVPTIDGGHIIYREVKKDLLVNIMSGESQRQTRATVDVLIALSRINAPTTITEYDGTVHNVEFMHTGNGAVEFNSIVDARLSDMWIGTIKVKTI